MPDPMQEALLRMRRKDDLWRISKRREARQRGMLFSLVFAGLAAMFVATDNLPLALLHILGGLFYGFKAITGWPWQS